MEASTLEVDLIPDLHLLESAPAFRCVEKVVG